MKKLKVAKVLSLVLVLPAGMVLVTFAVVNRGPVTIDFWPLPMDMQAPLSAMIMLSLIVGVIWGGAASWLAAARVGLSMGAACLFFGHCPSFRARPSRTLRDANGLRVSGRVGCR